ncbi:MAG: DNA-processing protein DprA, partial [Candidatus Bathyarchaeia archaeon]
MFEVETAFVLLFGTWEKRQIPVCSWRWWPRVAEILSSNDWGNVGRALWKAGLWEGSAVWEDLRAWQKARAVMRRWGEKGWEPLIPMSPKYPPRLWRRLGWRAPALLWGKGCKEFMGSPGVAIVGSRELNEEEEEFAEAVGMICARLGFKVVSGGARGADQSGSQGCVEAGGFAVHFLPGGKSEDGVCGHGLLTIDPAEGVFDRVLALQRNRWIYSSSEAGV